MIQTENLFEALITLAKFIVGEEQRVETHHDEGEIIDTHKDKYPEMHEKANQNNYGPGLSRPDQKWKAKLPGQREVGHKYDKRAPAGQ